MDGRASRFGALSEVVVVFERAARAGYNATP